MAVDNEARSIHSKEVRLNYPLVQFKNKNIASDLKVLVGNEGYDNDQNLKMFNSFQILKVKNGNVEFELPKKTCF